MHTTDPSTIPAGTPLPGYYRLAGDYHYKQGSRKQNADPWECKHFRAGMVVSIEHSRSESDVCGHITIVYALTPHRTSWGSYRTDRLKIGAYTGRNKWEPCLETLPTAVRGLLVPALVSTMSIDDILCLLHCDKSEAFEALLDLYDERAPGGYTRQEWLVYAINKHRANEEARESAEQADTTPDPSTLQ